MSGRDDRDTRELLDELETTLDALREDLAGRESGRGRPPTPRELLRVTEEYTIPTVIATLEAAIAALELVRAVLRIADPDRSLTDRSDRPATDPVGRAGETAVAGAERALSELREALSAADPPDDPAARGLVADARELSAEVEARLREAREGREPRDRSASDDSGRGVRIEVDDGQAGETTGDGKDTGDETDGDGAGVDVDAELESIRREVRDAPDESPETGGSEGPEAGGTDESTGTDGPTGTDDAD